MNFEDELERNLLRDDVDIIHDRIVQVIDSSTSQSPPPSPQIVLPPEIMNGGYLRPPVLRQTKKCALTQTQWTRINDHVQEHFSSHVNIGGTFQKIPIGIHALKISAKQGWVLYKKRECERRKRARVKIEQLRVERSVGSHQKMDEKERETEFAKLMMMIVEMCENCRKMYVTVNLFWGVTLCDLCYYCPIVINGIMERKIENTNTFFSSFGEPYTSPNSPPPPPLFPPYPPSKTYSCCDTSCEEEEDVNEFKNFCLDVASDNSFESHMTNTFNIFEGVMTKQEREFEEEAGSTTEKNK